MSVARSEDKGRILKNLVRFQSEVNLVMAVSQENQICSIRKNELDSLELLISLMIESLASSLNSKNTMNDFQIDECTLLIIEKYWMLRPEEILLVFKNAKLGKYGTDFNRIDILTICTWLNTYIDQERTPYFERLNQQRTPDLISKEEFDKKYAELLTDYRDNPNKFAEEAKERQYAEYEIKRQKYIDGEKEAAFQEFQKNYYENRKPIEL